MNTPFVQLHFQLLPPPGTVAPQALFAIKSCFPDAVRRMNGCLSGSGGCRVGAACPCRSLFDQSLTPDPAALRRYQKPPLPFAFSVPLLPEKHFGRQAVELSLVIVGEAVNHTGLLVKGVLGMFGQPGTFGGWRVESVAAAAGDGTRTLVPVDLLSDCCSSLPLLSFDEIFSQCSSSCTRVTVEFRTPLRLLHRGSPLREIGFSVFAGALFRRVSSLAYYYGKEELSHDFKWLAAKSREIACSQRELRWMNRGGGLQGIEGVVEFVGDLADFMPFLALGSRLNLGKGAAYGMGNYRFTLQ